MHLFGIGVGVGLSIFWGSLSVGSHLMIWCSHIVISVNRIKKISIRTVCQRILQRVIVVVWSMS